MCMVLSLEGKDASKPAGNLFHLLMVLLTKEYLRITIRSFLKPRNLNS